MPLTAAARAGKLRVVELLLEAGDHLDKARWAPGRALLPFDNSHSVVKVSLHKKRSSIKGSLDLSLVFSFLKKSLIIALMQDAPSHAQAIVKSQSPLCVAKRRRCEGEKSAMRKCQRFRDWRRWGCFGCLASVRCRKPVASVLKRQRSSSVCPKDAGNGGQF